ncbi:hypothetical protein NUW54_g9178 [Trametes sanguinea]|uniref:Uncharacterized protein n=1 Tax=Trametes sanguinea TaxID=158606 RepID=A0ACC1P9A2_9APHY|nr:hypothetical protein NUW54_g9178 [Trametes sanguinea]
MPPTRTRAPLLPVAISQSPLLSGPLPDDLFSSLVKPLPTITIGFCDPSPPRLVPGRPTAHHNLRRPTSSGAAAIYGESGIIAESTTRKRSASMVHRFVNSRDTSDHQASLGEDIEMNVKAYNDTGEVGPQASVIEIGPLGSAGTTRSQAK